MTSTSRASFFNGKAAWLILLLITIAALAVVILPVWIIFPFKPQSERGIALSYAMKRWSPLITVFVLGAGLVLVVLLWRNANRWWRKAALVVLIAPLLPATWFARQNHFEWMFNPLARASYAPANEATFINDSDVLLTVKSNGEAAAYPVRFLAYHHIVQDVVGGTSIAVTY